MKVKLTWVKSVSLDVVSQELEYTINNLGTVVVLEPSVEEFVFTVGEGDKLSVSLRAFNGKKYSASAKADFVAPTVPMPEAPTNLVFTVVE